MFPRVGGWVVASRMTTDFKAHATDLGGGLVTVVVAGEADLYTAPELKEALIGAIEGGARRVLLDLSSSTFIDSTTLGVLHRRRSPARPAGGELAIACPDPNIRRSSRSRCSTGSSAIFPTPRDSGLTLPAGRNRVAAPDAVSCPRAAWRTTTRLPPSPTRSTDSSVDRPRDGEPQPGPRHCRSSPSFCCGSPGIEAARRSR